jgi:hypothetical protein
MEHLKDILVGLGAAAAYVAVVAWLFPKLGIRS